MKRTPHVPQRTCLACRAPRAKMDLLRIVRTAAGEVVVDLTGKTAGRGTYLCKNITCAQQAWKQKKLSRALAMPVGDDVFEHISAILAETGDA